MVFGINNTFIYKLNKSLSATTIVRAISSYSPHYILYYCNKYDCNLNTIMNLGIQYKL